VLPEVQGLECLVGLIEKMDGYFSQDCLWGDNILMMQTQLNIQIDTVFSTSKSLAIDALDRVLVGIEDKQISAMIKHVSLSFLEADLRCDFVHHRDQ
jgi:hypothetical protein